MIIYHKKWLISDLIPQKYENFDFFKNFRPCFKRSKLTKKNENLRVRSKVNGSKEWKDARAKVDLISLDCLVSPFWTVLFHFLRLSGSIRLDRPVFDDPRPSNSDLTQLGQNNFGKSELFVFFRNQIWDQSMKNYRIRGLVNGRTTIVFDLVNNTLFWDNFPFRWFDICLIIDNNVTSLTLKIELKSCFRHQVAFKSVFTSPWSSLEG